MHKPTPVNTYSITFAGITKAVLLTCTFFLNCDILKNIHGYKLIFETSCFEMLGGIADCDYTFKPLS